jgi:ribosomal protein S27AE
LASVGRPATKKGPKAAKHRAASREEYRGLPDSGKKKRVASRDKTAQRKADAKRLSTQRNKRNAYHKADAKATRGIPKGTKCANCGSTTNIQRHVVNGKFKQYLCGRCNVKAIGGGK